MKYLALLLSITLLSLISPRDIKKVSKMNFCGKEIKVSGECTAYSEYELVCKDFAIQWMYMDTQMIEYMPESIIKELEGKLPSFEKEEITVYSMGNKLTGFLITNKLNVEKRYYIVAYGIVNNHPVLLNIGLTNEPIRNEHLPLMVGKIINIHDSATMGTEK